MTREEIVADLDAEIGVHLEAIRKAAEADSRQLLESTLRRVTGKLQGLWEAKAVVTRLPER